MPLVPISGIEGLPLAALTIAPQSQSETKTKQKAPTRKKDYNKKKLPEKRSSERRSRNGCFSCKKLKIKCDEATPSCEYCSHTGRICVYPPAAIARRKERGSDTGRSPSASEPITKPGSTLSSSSGETEEQYLGKRILADITLVGDVSNRHLKTLNSMQARMNITRFEQKLLKFYLDFGGAFFTGNKNSLVKKVIESDAPRLWNQSELIKNSIYAVATMYLWRFYQLNSISNIYLSGDQYLVIYTNNDPHAKSLFEITDGYIQNTFARLKEGFEHINLFTNLDDVGCVMLANVFLFTTISVHPVSKDILGSFDGTSNYLTAICQVSSGIFSIAATRADLIEGSAYESLLYNDEIKIKPPPDQPTLFPFIEHLRGYVDRKVPIDDIFFAVYHNAVDEFESACFRAVRFRYVLPILRGIMGISTNVSFLELLRQKDYLAMKIMYYFCSVVSICGIKMFMEASLWDSFVAEFKDWVDSTIGGFEEQFDFMMYRHVHDRIADAYKRRGKPFLDPEQLLLIGSGNPLDTAMGIAQGIRW